MPKSANQITFDLKPLKVGEGWYIVVTYPGGMQEHIPGFHSQAEAEQWLSGSHNGYFQDSRYVYFHDNPHPTTSPPLVLTPGHQYLLRDWVGTTNQNQWYKFALDSTRNVTIQFQNLYGGAAATIETESGGTIVAATTYNNASTFGPLLPTQSYSGALPADTYLLHISFSGVGAPGTTFALSLTAQ